MKNTVLIVDDAPLYQEVLKGILESLNYQPVVAADGDEAMAYVKEHRDELVAVLLDIYMPNIDGISALGHFHVNYPGLPTVIITGSEDTDDERITKELGAHGYLKKPFDPSSIRETIEGMLRPLAGM